MAYVRLYKHEWIDTAGNERVLFIEKDDGIGSLQTITAHGRQHTYTTWRVTKDEFSQLMPSSTKVQVFDLEDFEIGDELSDIITGAEFRVVIEDGSSNVLWTGFIESGQVSQNEDGGISVLEFNATDLSRLKKIPFVDGAGDLYEGRATVRNIIQDCLNELGFGYSCHFHSNLFPGGLSAGIAEWDLPIDEVFAPRDLMRAQQILPFDQAQRKDPELLIQILGLPDPTKDNVRIYTDQDGQLVAAEESSISCWQVLEKLCASFLLQIKQHNGAFYIHQTTSSESATIRLWEYDDDKVLQGSSVENARWAPADSDRDRSPGTRSRAQRHSGARISYEHGSVELLRDPGLNYLASGLPPGWVYWSRSSPNVKPRVLDTQAYLPNGVDVGAQMPVMFGSTLSFIGAPFDYDPDEYIYQLASFYVPEGGVGEENSLLLTWETALGGNSSLLEDGVPISYAHFQSIILVFHADSGTDYYLTTFAGVPFWVTPLPAFEERWLKIPFTPPGNAEWASLSFLTPEVPDSGVVDVYIGSVFHGPPFGGAFNTPALWSYAATDNISLKPVFGDDTLNGKTLIVTNWATRDEESVYEHPTLRFADGPTAAHRGSLTFDVDGEEPTHDWKVGFYDTGDMDSGDSLSTLLSRILIQQKHKARLQHAARYHDQATLPAPWQTVTRLGSYFLPTTYGYDWVKHAVDFQGVQMRQEAVVDDIDYTGQGSGLPGSFATPGSGAAQVSLLAAMNFDGTRHVAQTDATVSAGATTSIPIATMTEALLDVNDQIVLVDPVRLAVHNLTVAADQVIADDTLSIDSYTFPRDIAYPAFIYKVEAEVVTSVVAAERGFRVLAQGGADLIVGANYSGSTSTITLDSASPLDIRAGARLRIKHQNGDPDTRIALSAAVHRGDTSIAIVTQDIDAETQDGIVLEGHVSQGQLEITRNDITLAVEGGSGDPVGSRIGVTLNRHVAATLDELVIDYDGNSLPFALDAGSIIRLIGQTPDGEFDHIEGVYNLKVLAPTASVSGGSDGSVSISGFRFTSASAAFSTASVGRTIRIPSGSNAGDRKIIRFVSATEVDVDTSFAATESSIVYTVHESFYPAGFTGNIRIPQTVITAEAGSRITLASVQSRWVRTALNLSLSGIEIEARKFGSTDWDGVVDAAGEITTPGTRGWMLSGAGDADITGTLHFGQGAGEAGPSGIVFDGVLGKFDGPSLSWVDGPSYARMGSSVDLGAMIGWSYEANVATGFAAPSIDFATNTLSQNGKLIARRTLQSSDPTVDTDVSLGFLPGDIIVNTDTDSAFVCADNTDGAAVWIAVGGGSVPDPLFVDDLIVSDYLGLPGGSAYVTDGDMYLPSPFTVNGDEFWGSTFATQHLIFWTDSHVISSGAIDYNTGILNVRSETAGVADDLDTINFPAGMPDEGAFVFIRGALSTGTITFTESGNLVLVSTADSIGVGGLAVAVRGLSATGYKWFVRVLSDPSPSTDSLVYPEEFGATELDTSGDAAAVLAAVTYAASERRTLFLSRIYQMGDEPLITPQLDAWPPRPYDYLRITGNGSYSSGLEWSGYGEDDKMIWLRSMAEFELSNICLLGDADYDPVIQRGYGLWLGDTSVPTEKTAAVRFRVLNCRIQRWKAGVVLSRCWIADFFSCNLNHNLDGVITGYDGPTGDYPLAQANIVNFYGGNIESCDRWGVNLQLTNSSNINFYGVTIEGNGAFNWYPASAWASAEDYLENRHPYNGTVAGVHANTVTYNVNDASGGSTQYRCTVDHTSSAATEPGVGASWATVWEVYDHWADEYDPAGIEDYAGGEVRVDGNWYQFTFDSCYFEKGEKYNALFQINCDDTIVGPPPTTHSQTGGQKGRRMVIRDCSFSAYNLRTRCIFDNIDQLDIIRPAKPYFGHHWEILDGVKKWTLDDPNLDAVFKYSPSMWMPISSKDGHGESYWYRSNFSEIDASKFPITTTNQVVELDPSGRVTLRMTGGGGVIDVETTERQTGPYSLKIGGGGTTDLAIRIKDPRDNDWVRRIFDEAEEDRGFWHYFKLKASNKKCWIYPYIAVIWWKDVGGTPTAQTASANLRAFPGYFWGETIDNKWGWSIAQYKGTGTDPHTSIQDIIDDPDFLYIDYIEVRVRVESGNSLDADQFIYLDEIRFSTNRWGVSKIGVDAADTNSPLVHKPIVSWSQESYSDQYRPATQRPYATLLNRNRELYEPGERQWTVGTLPPVSTQTALPLSKYSFYQEAGAANEIVLAPGPHGRMIPVWQSTSDGSSATQGGLRAPSKEVNHLDGFYASIYMQAVTGPDDATQFARVYDPDVTLVDAQTGAPSQQFAGMTLPQTGRWYLFRTFVHASNEPNIPLANVPNVGVYDALTKEKVADVQRTLRMTTATKQVRVSGYTYNAGSPSGVRRYYVYPSLIQDVGEDLYDPYFNFALVGEDGALVQETLYVKNGDGAYADTTGWSSWTNGTHVGWDPSIIRDAGQSRRGAFYSDRYLSTFGNGALGMDAFYPVNPSRHYKIEAQYCALGTDPSHVYVFYACFDAAGNLVARHHEARNATAYGTLSANAYDGELSVFLDDTTNWADGPFSDYLVAYPYQGHPVGTYSRRAMLIDWSNSLGSGGSAANEITLLDELDGDISPGTSTSLDANIASASQTAITIGNSSLSKGQVLHLQNGATWERIRIVTNDGGGDYTVERGVEGSTAQSSWTAGVDIKFDADLIVFNQASAIYNYIVLNQEIELSDGWQSISHTIDKGMFPTTGSDGFRQGTAFIRIGFLPNYNDTATAEGEHVIAWTEVSIRDITGDGEVNTASNVGAGTVQVFKQKTGVDFELRSLTETQFEISSDVIQLKQMSALVEDATADVTQTAGASYTSNEQDMLNAVKTLLLEVKATLNELRGKMESQGYLEP